LKTTNLEDQDETQRREIESRNRRLNSYSVVRWSAAEHGGPELLQR